MFSDKMAYNTQHSSKGFSLIELVMTIVIAAIVLIPTSIIIIESVRSTFLPEHFTIASSLLEGEIERVTNLRFSDVVAEGQTNYSGNFSDYLYQVSFYYVNAGALNTQVAGPTDYRRVTVTISRAGFPDISGVTVATNN